MKSRREYLDAFRRMEFLYAKDDPVYFADHYCYFEDKDSEDVIVPFRPWPAQKEALLAIARDRLSLFLKARQIGITWVALIYCAHDLIFHPGHTVIALSKTQNDACELVRRFGILLEHMKSLLAGGNLRCEIRKNEVEIQSSDGRVSRFKSFAASPSAGRSFTANILLIDEWAFQEYAREIWASAYPTINRPTGGKVIGISTMKRGSLFEELWTTENGFTKHFISVFADPRRNAAWYEATKRDIGERILQEYPRTAEEALADVGGRFFHEFDPALHICEPFEIPRDWQIYTTMDYGLDMLAHYKIAVDSEKNCYVFHEIYKSGLVVSEASELIHKADGYNGENWKLPRERLAPPDLFARELTSGKSQAAGFAEHGIRLTKSSNNRETGWLYVKELLKCRVLPDGRRMARLHIFSTCRHLTRTLASILVDEKNPCDCKREPHELTHAPDALRYFAVWWYKPPDVKKRVEAHWTEDMWEDYDNADEGARRRMEERWAR
ncbi:MAG: hypothetical protein IJW46_05375 [Clostridia bacterium]|nr:hypothetical protein [Clostridia bacterium]